MEKIKVKLPKRFTFRTEVRICSGDINYGGHLGYDRMLTIMQEARLRFLEKHGFTELDAGGAGLVVRDASVIYRREVFRGDVLEVEMAAVNRRKRGFDFVCRITDKSSGREAARSKVGMTFFDYTSRGSVAVPEAFTEKVFRGVD